MTRNTMTTPERIELLREAIEAAQQHYHKEHYRANASVNYISEDLKENRTTSERSYIERELQQEKDIIEVSGRHWENLSHALEHLQEGWSVLPNDERFVEPIITGIGRLRTLIDEERSRWGRTPIDSREFNIDEAINRYERCGQGKEDYDDAVRFSNLHKLMVWLEGEEALPTVEEGSSTPIEPLPEIRTVLAAHKPGNKWPESIIGRDGEVLGRLFIPGGATIPGAVRYFCELYQYPDPTEALKRAVYRSVENKK
ncbi:MAG: hypothetical protein RI826_05250 [Chlorobium phaeovibrioides]|nr:hypothetical protein [Chlorobium phaeovibrioides]